MSYYVIAKMDNGIETYLCDIHRLKYGEEDYLDYEFSPDISDAFYYMTFKEIKSAVNQIKNSITSSITIFPYDAYITEVIVETHFIEYI